MPFFSISLAVVIRWVHWSVTEELNVAPCCSTRALMSAARRNTGQPHLHFRVGSVFFPRDPGSSPWLLLTLLVTSKSATDGNDQGFERSRSHCVWSQVNSFGGKGSIWRKGETVRAEGIRKVCSSVVERETRNSNAMRGLNWVNWRKRKVWYTKMKKRRRGTGLRGFLKLEYETSSSFDTWEIRHSGGCCLDTSQATPAKTSQSTHVKRCSSFLPCLSRSDPIVFFWWLCQDLRAH